jgi:cell division protease FtsH
MICEWGMSEKLGPISFHADDQRPYPDMGGREYSESTAQEIDREIHQLIDEAYQKTQKLIEENSDKIEAVAENLLKYETLEASDVDTLMKGGEIVKPALGETSEEEQKPEEEPVAASDSGLTDTGPAPGQPIPSPG